ncbi:DUF4954 family protein [Sphingobacterium psychroaquaticum]|uniref:DUF4954 domain-containing protein n=1 Tax=Sphingobacterium psychroaquaticum TaxID=561061 RepID=A0A1X7LAX0_9SPHI|nr:DUF4954 family protein [Sphingobacterium psychroaquaticum]SMG50981.1 protein of unknown function [Sphingobacterium psychroaquaticum]
MSHVVKQSLARLGYDFVPEPYLVEGDEYHHRNRQFKADRSYRQLTIEEIETLTTNNNYSSNWDHIWVTDKFIPRLVQNNKFYGFIRIGDMEEVFLDYRELRLPCGIYNSTIVSCDIGHTVAISHVRFISHFIVGNDVILANVNEMTTSNNAKFGNGILKVGDVEERRIQLELCNENGGRSVLPFDGMQAGDVFLWSRYRADDELQTRFRELTENKYSIERGFYSTIGDRCVIKNTQTIKDVKIGTDAYIKGVNKLKNLTINSSQEAFTQIGEGCELVNGIIGYGCRIFYGVKAVRFVLSSFSQLKYGARLINSFLGDNSTISCCEVLNSLIFPAHEQHHNNSFLCAALVKGQSNMAAGATVGSNHNSRAADGEIIAGRGFWPGLCVSLKHNSRFASYSLIVKGDFLHELDVKFPFCLISNEVDTNRLVVLPGYWFMYNMYALMRNTSKFMARDKRRFKNQHIEYDILAPDTINEMFVALSEIEKAVGKTMGKGADMTSEQTFGRQLLTNEQPWPKQDVFLENVEYSKRKVVLAKPYEAYNLYKRMIRYYGAMQVFSFLEQHDWSSFQAQVAHLPPRFEVENIGGQLFRLDRLAHLLDGIRTGRYNSWEEVHAYYHQCSADYPLDKFLHGVAALVEITDRPIETWDKNFVSALLEEARETKRWIFHEIVNSRHKDYENPYKQMVYDSYEEMEAVIGKFEDNDFINKETIALEAFEVSLDNLIAKL